jgi:hypothetical protein
MDEVLAEDEIVGLHGTQEINGCVEKLRVIFKLESAVDFNGGVVFLLKGAYTFHIKGRFLRLHSKPGIEAVRIADNRGVVGKSQALKACGDSRLYVFSVSAACVIAAGGVGMIIMFEIHCTAVFIRK